MSKTNNAKFIFLILLLPLFLTGCYDRFELDNLAYVIAIGVDPGENGNVNITYQIAVPLKITGENSETGKETYTTYTVIPITQTKKESFLIGSGNKIVMWS